jgi:hypothetical protein
MCTDRVRQRNFTRVVRSASSCGEPGVENMLGHAPPPLAVIGLDMRSGHPAAMTDPRGRLTRQEQWQTAAWAANHQCSRSTVGGKKTCAQQSFHRQLRGEAAVQLSRRGAGCWGRRRSRLAAVIHRNPGADIWGKFGKLLTATFPLQLSY